MLKMNTCDISKIKDWIGRSYVIVLWGSSDPAIRKITRITEISVAKSIRVVDKNYVGKEVTIGDKHLKVESPETYLGQDVKWILFATRRASYAQLCSVLAGNGYEYEKDFIDGMSLPETVSEYPHGIPEIVTYMPWENDREFLDLMDHIKNNTLVDVYRLYDLWSLVKQTGKCKEGDALEVGVWRGGTGALIAKAFSEFSGSGKVFLADTFEGVVKSGEEDPFYSDSEHDDTSQEIVESLLKDMSIDNAVILKGVFPDDFEGKYVDKRWRFVHIDVDVYRSAKDVFEYVWPNVVPGGCVVFDDYGFETCPGITKLCNELANSVADGIFVFNLNQHGMFVKV